MVAIHQPNFFPWLGYFDKIIKSDIFVFMDDVAYPKSGSGNWSNRVKLLVQGQSQWWGVPIVRNSGVQIIRDVQLASSNLHFKKMIRTLEFNYKRCPFFEENFEWLSSMVLRETKCLSEYNILNIREIVERLNIKANFILQSSLETQKASTEVLIEITKKVGGTSYLCGGGATGYQDDEKIVHSGIELVYQKFQHPKYLQHNNKEDFIPGLSIIDSLMNRGLEGTKQLLQEV